MGAVFAIPAGLLLTWAFDECRARKAPVRLRDGALFGLYVVDQDGNQVDVLTVLHSSLQFGSLNFEDDGQAV